MTTLITRRDAVNAIAQHLTDRTAFIVFASPALLAEAADRLKEVPGWTGYLDTGDPLVTEADCRTFTALGALAGVFGIPVAAVLVIPKTVPAAVLSRALRQRVAADGSQDILVVHGRQRVHWPLLFVDALQRVDPAAAAQLHANSIGRLS